MDPLLDYAPCGFLSLAEDGAILAVNDTLRRWLALAPGEVEGRHVDAILTPAGRIFYQTHLYPAVKVTGWVEEIYLALRGRGGVPLAVLVNGVRRERGGASVTDWVLVRMQERERYEDELLRAKRAAEQASEAKAKFLSMMSHELRTPLQAISGFAELLGSGMHGPLSPEQVEDLGWIRSATRQLVRLIDDILGFARMQTGGVDVVVGTVRVDEALARVEALMTQRLREAGLAYARERLEPGVAVRADPDRLQQILLNLLANAAKFTRRGGTVSVACSVVGGRAFIRVRDTGCGVPPEDRERIFEPFVQLERGQSAGGERGLGLGLAISRDLARAMGGDLTIESQVGVGSVFTLALPAAEAPEWTGAAAG